MTTAPDVNRSWSITAKNPVGSGTYIARSGSLVIDRSYQVNFRDLVRRGAFLPPLYYKRTLSETVTNVVRNDTYDTSTDPNGVLLAIGNINAGDLMAIPYVEKIPTGSTYTQADVEAIAAQKYYSDSARFKTNIGVQVAEAPKTFRMIASVATKLARSFRFLKKLQVTKAMRELGYSNEKLRKSLNDKARRRNSKRNPGRFAAASWLELQYGWKPLIQGAYDGAEDLAQRFNRNPADISVRGRCTKKNHWNYRKINPLPGTIGPATGFSVFSVAPSYDLIRVEYGATLRVVNPTLRAKASLGLTNPAVIAWELVPFSFVVDWFVPVSDYLESFTATQGMTFLNGYKTVYRKNHYGVGMSGGTDKNSKSSSTGRFFKLRGTAKYEVTSFFFERTITVSHPPNSKVLRVKKISEIFSTGHLSNALALLRTTFGR